MTRPAHVFHYRLCEVRDIHRFDDVAVVSPQAFTYNAPVPPFATVVIPVTETLTFTVTDSDGATTSATVTFTVF